MTVQGVAFVPGVQYSSNEGTIGLHFPLARVNSAEKMRSFSVHVIKIVRSCDCHMQEFPIAREDSSVTTLTTDHLLVYSATGSRMGAKRGGGVLVIVSVRTGVS